MSITTPYTPIAARASRTDNQLVVSAAVSVPVAAAPIRITARVGQQLYSRSVPVPLSSPTSVGTPPGDSPVFASVGAHFSFPDGGGGYDSDRSHIVEVKVDQEGRRVPSLTQIHLWSLEPPLLSLAGEAGEGEADEEEAGQLMFDCE